MSTYSKVEEEPFISLPYFHGALLDEDADRMVAKDGDFLLQTRDERGYKKPRLLLVVRKESVYRLDIRRTEGGFRLNGKICPGVDQLITYWSGPDKIIEITAGEKIFLRKPVPRSKFQLSHNDIKILKKIGAGAYGTVYKGILLCNKRHVAIKRIDNESSDEALTEMWKEARVMQLYDHRNIVRFYGFIVDRPPCLLVMEFCQDGAVEDRLRKLGKNVTIPQRVDMLVQAAAGMEYLHFKNNIHRDIATRNCLLHGSILKLADFGMCRATAVYKVDLSKPTNLRWLAPEVWRSGETNFSTDVYAFGVMIWEMFEIPLITPYNEWKGYIVKERVMAGYRMAAPKYTPDEIKPILEAAWNHDPSVRPTASQLRSQLESVNRTYNPEKSGDVTQEMSSAATGSLIQSLARPIGSPDTPKAKKRGPGSKRR